MVLHAASVIPSLLSWNRFAITLASSLLLAVPKFSPRCGLAMEEKLAEKSNSQNLMLIFYHQRNGHSTFSYNAGQPTQMRCLWTV